MTSIVRTSLSTFSQTDSILGHFSQAFQLVDKTSHRLVNPKHRHVSKKDSAFSKTASFWVFLRFRINSLHRLVNRMHRSVNFSKTGSPGSPGSNWLSTCMTSPSLLRKRPWPNTPGVWPYCLYYPGFRDGASVSRALTSRSFFEKGDARVSRKTADTEPTRRGVRGFFR